MIYRLTISPPQLRHVKLATSLYPMLVPSVRSLPSAPNFDSSQAASLGYNILLVEQDWLAVYVRKAQADWLSAVFEFLSGLRPGHSVFHLLTEDQLESFQEPICFLDCSPHPSEFTTQAQLVAWWFSYWTAQFSAERERVFLWAEGILTRTAQHPDSGFDLNRSIPI